MPDEVKEEELLRSIEEVDAKIQRFRKRVRALLASIQAERRPRSADSDTSAAS
jgi:hypothetical protein